MEPKTIEEFIDAGCELSDPLRLFIGLYHATAGQPCNGCAYDSHGNKCQAKRALFQAPAVATPDAPRGETVREAAARLGVSISEVRRRRRTA